MHQTAYPDGWADLVFRYEAHLRAANRTAQTIETRTEHVRRLARAFPDGPEQLTSDHWITWSAAHTWSTETRRSFTASVRSFYGWLDGTDPTADVPPIAPAQPNPRPIPHDLLIAALQAAEPRTRLILRLAAEASLRRIEIARVRGTDAAIGRPCMLTIHGKGNRPRQVPISRSLAVEIARAGDDWLFPGKDGHLTARHIGVLARRVLPTPWTLHTLRHRFASKAYEESHNLLAVQRLLGHSSPAVTQRYVLISLDELEAAAAHARIYE